MRFEQPAGELDLYVLAAATPLGVVQAYARLTGRTPMMPRWALGYHQCRYSYMNEAEVRDVAREFRDRAHPVRHALLRHPLHGRLPRVHVGPERLPRPGRAHRRPRRGRLPFGRHRRPGRQGGRPGLRRLPRGRSARRVRPLPGRRRAGGAGRARRGLARHLRLPGLHARRRPRVVGRAARRARPDRRRRHLERHERAGPVLGRPRRGLDGRRARRRDAAGRRAARLRGTAGAPARDARRGAQRLRHADAARDLRRPARALQPDARPFTITRAAYAGAQRYGTGWTGDNTASWDHLTLAIQQTLSLGASGMPFVGADVGGFIDVPSGELLARWTQVGALTPLFRNHSAD